MENKVKGKLIKVMDAVTFDSGFVKREFVVETDEQYPQKLKCELIKDKCDLIDSFSLGDILEVSVNYRGSEYKEKYYVSFNAWRIEKDSSPNDKKETAPVEAEGVDDLPF